MATAGGEDGPTGAAVGASVNVALTVNGRPVTRTIPALRRLVTFLREDLGLTATKVGCEVGFCGLCSVLVDGRPVSSCHTLAAQVDGCAVVTLEGLSDDPRMQRLQEAFVSEGGFQCGYCTSGQLVMAAALLRDAEAGSGDRREAGSGDRRETGSGDTRDDAGRLEDETIRRHMAGTLCRCTGYYGIVRAIRAAAG